MELVPTSGTVEELRAVKDAGELARMARAASIADEALAEVLDAARRARDGPERRSPKRRFAASHSITRCACAGPRSGRSRRSSRPARTPPSPTPGRAERPIRSGEAVVIDFGAVFDGYRSDMTRTFWIGGDADR